MLLPHLCRRESGWRKPHTQHCMSHIKFWTIDLRWLRIRLLMQETWVPSPGREDPLEKEMAAHSSTLAWEAPWTEEPGGLQSKSLQRVGHNWVSKQQPQAHHQCRPIPSTFLRFHSLCCSPPQLFHIFSSLLKPLAPSAQFSVPVAGLPWILFHWENRSK